MAVDFEAGSGQRISYAVDPDWNDLTALSISCWVNVESDANINFLSKWSFSPDDKSFLLHYSTGSNGWRVEWIDPSSASDSVVVSETAPQNAGWTHLATTWATTTRNLYVNGAAGTADTTSRLSLIHI